MLCIVWDSTQRLYRNFWEEFDRHRENQPGDDECHFSLGIWLVCDISSPYIFTILPHMWFLSMGKPIYFFPICISVECSVGRKYLHYEISTFTAFRNKYLLQHIGPTETVCSMNISLHLHQSTIFLAIFFSVKISYTKIIQYNCNTM